MCARLVHKYSPEYIGTYVLKDEAIGGTGLSPEKKESTVEW